jgi:hypothetical protein
MKTITIGLSRAKGFGPLSKIIQWAENTEFSHAYVSFQSDSLDRELIYQASGTRVNFTGRKIFDGHAETTNTYKIQVSDEKYKEILQFCVDQAGKPYGIKNLFYIGWFYLTGHKISRGDNEESFICSELVGEILRMAGILYSDVNLDYYTPKNVYVTMELLK